MHVVLSCRLRQGSSMFERLCFELPAQIVCVRTAGRIPSEVDAHAFSNSTLKRTSENKHFMAQRSTAQHSTVPQTLLLSCLPCHQPARTNTHRLSKKQTAFRRRGFSCPSTSFGRTALHTFFASAEFFARTNARWPFLCDTFPIMIVEKTAHRRHHVMNPS